MVGQWHAIANPHLGGGSRRIRNSGLSLATESSYPVWYALVLSSKQNKQGFWRKNIPGCRCSSGGSLAKKNVCALQPRCLFNPVDRQLKIPVLIGNEVLVPLWNPVVEQTTPDTSEAWLHYCGAYTCNNQWTRFPGVQKSHLSSW